MEFPKLHLFGLPRLEWDGQFQQLAVNTPVSLLIRLAVASDWLPRQQLAWLYRPDSDEEDALRYLRLQLHRAQQYPWAAGLEVERDRLRWQAETDLAEFRAAVTLGDWPSALVLAGAPLLAGQYPKGQEEFGEWLSEEQAQTDRDLRQALLQQAAVLEKEGGYAEAASLCRRALQLNELDEEAVSVLLRSLALAGQRDEALRVYHGFRELLHSELNMLPSDGTTELAALIERGGLPGTLREVKVGPRLPRAATGFIGRAEELAQLEALLSDPDCRLLSLIGIGGSGKTRLALALAEQSGAEFRDGHVFVPLLLAHDAEAAVREIAAAVGSAAGNSLELAASIGDSHQLLILDNCEQVEGLTGLLETLLSHCPELRILVTSRRRPELSGGWTYDLTGLTTWRSSDGESEAFQLFEAAARRVAAGLSFTAADTEEIRRITQLVQGLPLALELAASWLRLMPVRSIRESLERDLELLETDQPDLEPRHRSLSAVLERTWNDLEPFAAEALMRFVSFSGSAGLAATQVVTGLSLPRLLSLVNQALLIRDDQGRIHIHPLLARFSLNRRAARPELAAAADAAHTDWYFRLLSERPRGTADERLAADLKPEISNIETAWFRLLAAGDTDRLLLMADVLFAFYSVHGQGTELQQRSLALLPADRAPLLRCRILLALSALLRERAAPAAALEHATEALELVQKYGLTDLTGVAHRHLGDAMQIAGDYSGALEQYRLATDMFEAADDSRELANALNSLGSLEAARENYAAAAGYFQRCSRLFAQLEDVLNHAIALNNLGYLEDVQGNTDAAAALYEDCLAAFTRVGFTRGAAAVHNNLVVLYGTLGRMDEAEQAGLASLALKQEMGDDQGRIITLKNLADLTLKRGRLEQARMRYLEALRLASSLGALPGLLKVLPGFCRTLRGTGEAERASELAQALLGHPLLSDSEKRAVAQDWPELDSGIAPDPERLEQVLKQYLPAETPLQRAAD